MPEWHWFNNQGWRAPANADDKEMKQIRKRLSQEETLLDTDRVLIYTLRGGEILCAWVRRDVIDEGKEAE